MNNQSESPFGNPKFLMALALTFFGLWGWQYYMSIKYPVQPAALKNSAATPSTDSNQPSAALADNQIAEPKSAAATAENSLAVPSEQLFDYQDENVQFQISSKGLGIKNFTLKKYTNRKGEQIRFEAFDGQAELFLNNNVVNFTVSKTSDTEFVGTAEINGQPVIRKLTYNKDKGSFDSEITIAEGLESASMRLFQKHQKPTSTNFLTPSFEQQDFIHIEAGSTKSESIAGLAENEGFLKTAPAATMASIGTQYFTVAAVNRSDILPSLSNKVENNMASVSLIYDLKNSKIKQLNHAIYLGPKRMDLLARIDQQLGETLNYGMFGFISILLMKLMTLMHSFLGNWGLAIIALTLVVRIVLLPFNIMSFRSAMAMQRIKPKMDAVRERFKDDPMRMNKETMALMKENNANPLSGCLPMLIQIPIFFALWTAIGSSIEIYQQPFFGWINDLTYHDPYFIFPILMGITMFLQQKMTPTTMDPMQAKILNFMPIIFTLFMLTLPSGLTLYNFVSALFGVIQQYFLLKETKTNSPQPA